MISSPYKIAIVIPAYKVASHIVRVVSRIPKDYLIFIVDDCCPEKSGELIEKEFSSSSNIYITYNSINLGVGGAVLEGYKAALRHHADIIVKIDGDGQMDSSKIPRLISPIISGDADYSKGNRFFNLDNINRMPKIRIFGNAVLSFVTKFSSGYWNIFDPTNGFTAIHSDVAKLLPFTKISKRYFFESDMLFRLNIMRAVVVDVPLDAQYGDEKSNLVIKKVIPLFLYKNFTNFLKRLFYSYYLRDISIGSFELPMGLLLFIGGGFFGLFNWHLSQIAGVNTPVGTVMLAALPILMGLQLLLAFIAQDIQTVPRKSIHKFYKTA